MMHVKASQKLQRSRFYVPIFAQSAREAGICPVTYWLLDKSSFFKVSSPFPQKPDGIIEFSLFDDKFKVTRLVILVANNVDIAPTKLLF
jgi:hypothetical protein